MTAHGFAGDHRDLAELVETEYRVGRPTRVRPLQLSRNRTFQVRTEQGDYALRVRGGNTWWIDGDSDLRFELDLLDHLASRGCGVSTAIPRRNGDRLGVVHDGDGPHRFSLFTWAPGRPGARSPNGAHLVGRALAQLHLAADSFVTDRHRYRLDEQTMLDRQLPAIEQAFEHTAPKHIRLIRGHIDDIRRRLRTFDPGPGGWGVIHGDVQELNFHVHDGKLVFFDFDLCAWGWRTADIAEYYTRIPPPHRAPFLAGYSSVRPLNPPERDMLLTIARLAWIREGCTADTLAHMLRDPFVRFRLGSAGAWEMRPPA